MGVKIDLARWRKSKDWGVCEQGAYEYIWTQDGWSDRRLEAVPLWIATQFVLSTKYNQDDQIEKDCADS